MKNFNTHKILILFILITCVQAKSSFLHAQNVGIITGRVIGTEENEPVIGATVVIKGTDYGVATNIEGRFTLTNVEAGQHTLLIRGVGFKSKEETVQVTANEKINLDISLENEVTTLGEIVISGMRKSQLAAISLKKQSLNNKEVLTSDDLGRLPDVNVAEAVQRVSGVSIETDKGEGQFVSIRGIQPSLNNVTLNNTNLGSTSTGRATPLDLMPTEIISSIEVVKTVTPDMEGNAIGGTININTISAFDRTGPFLIASFDGLIHDQQIEHQNFDDTKFPFRAALTAGKKFGEKENLGVVVSTNFFRRDFGMSVLDPDEWIYENYFLPNEIEMQNEDNERDRFGLNADIDYRFTSTNSVYLKALYTRTRQVALNSEFELTFEGDIINQTPTSGQWTAGSMELDLSEGDEVEDMSSFILGTKNQFGKFSTHLYGSYSRAQSDREGVDGTFENPGDTEEFIPLQYDTEPFFFDVRPVNPEYAEDPEIMKLRNVSLNTSDILEQVYELTADFKYDFDLSGKPAYLKLGGRYRTRTKDVDRASDSYDLSYNDVDATNPYTLTPFSIPTFPPVQGGAKPIHHGDANKFVAFVHDPVNLSDPDRIVLDEYDTEFDMYADDLYNEESVTAGYLMGVIDIGKLNAVVGFRVENTSTESRSNVLSEDEDSGELNVGQIVSDNSYTNFLPSVNLTATLTENLLVRASWTNTIGRPDYTTLSATSEFAFEETTTPGEFEGSLQEANPDLKPYESMNLDASLEYYFPQGGIIALGGFFKDIENQIYQVEEVRNDVTYDGKFFTELEYSQYRNADAAQLYGLEFSYDQPLTFLPGILGGLGITTNFALINSKVNIPNRPNEDIPLFRQAKNVYNAILYYQRKGLELRGAVSHRSEYLTEAASIYEYEDEIEAGIAVDEFDRYAASRTTFDFLIGYTLPGGKIRFSGQIRNISNEPEWSYQGNDTRYDRHQLTGPSYFLGVNLTL